MTRDLDQLDDTFARHEQLAPDADAVLARSREIAAGMRRRRWVVRATGGSVLGAGIVVGALTVPGLVEQPSHHSAVLRIAPAGDGSGSPASAATPTPSPSPTSGSGSTTYTQDQELTAYFDAGYDYNDAQSLAQLWHETGDITVTKAEAGGKLLAGEKLPIAASGASGSDGVSPTQASDLSEFFGAGYTYNDAVQLASLWHTNSYQAKIDGGAKLLAGDSLPLAPSGKPASADQRAMTTYFAAGYDYLDAVKLGRVWHETNINHVKVEAGKKLERGEKLPVGP